MFTLLPEQNKKSLFKEYRLRLFTVIFLFLTAFCLISTALLFPSYISLYFERGVLEDESARVGMEIKVKNEKGIVETLARINHTLAAVKPQQSGVLQVTKVILDKLPSGISIDRFVYTRGEKADSSLSLQGVAETRSELITFSRELEKQPDFSKVDLPISNLAKQSDVPFTLTVLGKF